MKKKWFWLVPVCALVLFVLADFCLKGNPFGCLSLKNHYQRIQLKRQVSRTVNAHKQQNEQLWQDFERKLSDAGSRKFAEARRNVPNVVRQFSKFAWNWKLCCKMAKDQICSTQDAQDFIAAELGPRILKPCEQGNAEIIDLLLSFQHQLRENDNQLRAELAQLADRSPYLDGNLPARTAFLENTGKIAGQVQSNAVSCALTTAGTVLEAIFLRQSVKILVRVCGAAASRLAGSAGIAAVCAAADGPIPAGDVIGAVLFVGGVAWTAYDIYEFTQVMPKKMHESLIRAVDQFSWEVRLQTRTAAKEMLNHYQKASDAVENSI